MAARLAPDDVRQTHQSLHHVVAHAAWSDEALLKQVRQSVLSEMEKNGAVAAWIVDDTGFVKKGRHSVGVVRQYCGQVGKQENCQVAVSLSVTTEEASLPIAWRLYLPKEWAEDQERREKTGVPPEIAFQTKPQIALEQIRKAVEEGVPVAPVLADAAYGDDTKFREGISELKLPYTVGVRGPTTVWPPGKAPLPAKPGKMGRPAKYLRRNKNHQPVSTKQLAESLPSRKWKTVMWREGSLKKLRSRFAAVRVRPAHRDFERSEPHPEQWLLIEWPSGENEPTKYWFSTAAADTPLRELVKLAKHRWIIERDYEELKHSNDGRQMRMLNSVKLTPAGHRQYDQANGGGHCQAKADIDEGQQSCLRDNQSLEQLIIPGVGDASAIGPSGNEGGEVSQDPLHCRIKPVRGIEQARGMHGHSLIDQHCGRRYSQAGSHLAKKIIRTGRFILEAFFERSGGEKRNCRQK